jgi:transposase
MAKETQKDESEIEVICSCCGYHLTRTAARLRRDTRVVCPNCGEEVVPEGHEDSGGRIQ